ncbi:TolB family protein [Actinoplanes regularis]|uniref:TolB family protein n=1 Tax=Actinoplanes regularis TaxID=52697 RepID=UPI0024A0B426|nr:hypothetical protein [Actinoplanes regularis]GLW30637.1 hypothetical protein Areg01_35770 [Actinoplanes regularis]
MPSAVLPSWTKRLAKVTALSTVAAVLLLCCAVNFTLLEWHPVGGAAKPAPQGAGSLPARIGAPSPWTADGRRAPIGAASVLYTSNTWLPDGSGYLTGLVGRADDTYRVTDLYGAAGMASVLSPDGTRLAADEGIADLATGRVTEYPGVSEETWFEAQAWSPDGGSVALLAGGWDDYGRNPGVRLVVYDVATAAMREIAPLSELGALAGWTVAFSPDGTRLAYQVEDRIRVLALADGANVDLPLPAGARIAGKGAWTPDGRGLLVVSGTNCDCGEYPVRWTVTTISAANGAVSGPSYTRDGVYALRVLGWWPSGQPVAAEYTATEDTAPTLFTDSAAQSGLTSQDDILAVRLIELGTARELLAGDDNGLAGDVESVDVPESVLAAGAVRAGDPPLLDADLLVTVMLILPPTGVLILLALGVWWTIARLSPAFRRRA